MEKMRSWPLLFILVGSIYFLTREESTPKPKQNVAAKPSPIPLTIIANNDALSPILDTAKDLLPGLVSPAVVATINGGTVSAVAAGASEIANAGAVIGPGAAPAAPVEAVSVVSNLIIGGLAIGQVANTFLGFGGSGIENDTFGSSIGGGGSESVDALARASQGFDTQIYPELPIYNA